MSEGIPTYWGDAFVAEGLPGNPAAVCRLAAPLAEGRMRAIAAEMNLSETAFVEPPTVPGGPFGLRWFTPEVEVPLCGHATLASGHVLLIEEGRRRERVRFASASGPLEAERVGDAVRIALPREDPIPAELPLAVGGALGAPADVVAARGPVSGKLLIELPTPEAVADLRPDFGALRRAVPEGTLSGIVVTARGRDGIDFVSRFFAPWSGIPEDPVTGSAHALLGPYWSPRLGRSRFRARQLSLRGGELTVDVEERSVRLTGRARVVARGTIDPRALA